MHDGAVLFCLGMLCSVCMRFVSECFALGTGKPAFVEISSDIVNPKINETERIGHSIFKSVVILERTLYLGGLVHVVNGLNVAFREHTDVETTRDRIGWSKRVCCSIRSNLLCTESNPLWMADSSVT